MKTIIHYANNKSYTYTGYTIDCWVDWGDNSLRLIKGINEFEKTLVVDLDDEVLYIEVRDPGCNYYSQWTNPKYDFSVIADVMTAKARSKVNRISNTQLLVKEVNTLIDKYGIEVDVEHYRCLGDTKKSLRNCIVLHGMDGME